MRLLFSLASLLLLVVPYSHTQEFEHTFLDDAFTLKWRLDEPNNKIIFTTQSKTPGWVGMGLGDTEFMRDAELVIGGVRPGEEEGTYHFMNKGTPNVPYLGVAWEFMSAVETVEQGTSVTTVVWERKLTTEEAEGVSFQLSRGQHMYILVAMGDTDLIEEAMRRDVRLMDLFDNDLSTTPKPEDPPTTTAGATSVIALITATIASSILLACNFAMHI